MLLSFRHSVLVIGILCAILSFLFFGRQQEVYTVILLVGVILAGLSFAWILIKDKGKTRLMWIGVVIVGIAIQQLSERWLIGRSFQLLITRNQILFDQANEIMQSKPGDASYWGIQHKNSKEKFSSTELEVLERLKQRVHLTYITKDSMRIFYETYGFLDVRGGVSYFYRDGADSRYTKIKGRWYF